MSDREKLIKLMFEALKYVEDACEWSTCEGCYLTSEVRDCRTIMAADHLISNGVTVQKWIPVSERLPSFEDAVQPTTYDDPAVLAVFKFDDRPRIWCIDVIRRNPEKFTHWMPLPPEPPKECE